MRASSSSTTYSPDKLIAGEAQLHDEKVTLLSGQNCLRGTVVGKISLAAQAVASAAVAGNTGNGTIGSVTADADVAAGVYRISCIEPAADGGTFQVENPSGVVVGTAVVGVAFNGPVNFTIADGATDFAAGDAFTVTVSYAAGSGKYVKSLAAAVDGSQDPLAIVAEDCDASEADAQCLLYTTGDFNEDELILGAGHTVDSIRAALRARGIFLISAQEA